MTRPSPTTTMPNTYANGGNTCALVDVFGYARGINSVIAARVKEVFGAVAAATAGS